MGYKECIFCGSDIILSRDKNYYFIECKNCGKYMTSLEKDELEDLISENKASDKKHIISGYIREMTDLTEWKQTYKISKDNFQSLFNNSRIPKTLIEKMDKLLLHLYRKIDYFGEELEIVIAPAISYARNRNECENIFLALKERKMFSLSALRDASSFVNFTTEGLESAEKLYKENPNTNQVFVAMWFTDRMEKIYKEAIIPACEACGYKAIIVSDKEHNESIPDRIIAEIKGSSFLIADFTGQRGGVYYEAGFAKGLGMPVIQTWDESINDGIEEDDKKEKLHFDVNHISTIHYRSKKPKELKKFEEALYYRIKATIGDSKFKKPDKKA